MIPPSAACNIAWWTGVAYLVNRRANMLTGLGLLQDAVWAETERAGTSGVC